MNEQQLDKLLDEFKASSHMPDVSGLLKRKLAYHKRFLSEKNLAVMQWGDFKEFARQIWALETNALALGRAAGKPNHPIKHYRESLRYLARGEGSVQQRVDDLLGGKQKLDYIGPAVIAELVAFLFPEEYLLKNSRDAEALKILGIDFKPQFGESFGQSLVRYSQAAAPVVERYKSRIGSLADLPINVEVDQFFSWLYNKEEADMDESGAKGPRFWLISPGERAEQWEEFYKNNVMAIGWTKTGDLGKFAKRSEMQKKLKEEYPGETDMSGSATNCWAFAKEIKNGDYVIAKKGMQTVLGWGRVTAPYHHENTSSDFPHVIDVQWRVKKEVRLPKGQNAARGTLHEVDKKRGEKLIALFGTVTPMSMESKNLIFYGPPGTGKTYRARQVAERICGSSIGPASGASALVTTLLEMPWNDVLVAVMAIRGESNYSVPELRDDEIMKIYIDLKSSNHPNHTLWNRLQKESRLESETVKTQGKSGRGWFDKTQDSRWYLTDAGKEYASQIEDQIESLKNPKAAPVEAKDTLEVVTFHQSYSYEDFVEGIRPVLDDGELRYELKDGLFKQLCRKAAATPGQNYVLLIDEINRGNVSKIFGELISLLEVNKRAGEKEAMSVKLPYSGESLSVPSNLHVIGTMNTADRSIALIDSALRRRFDFEEVAPDPSLLKSFSVDGVDLAKLLAELNLRVELILDRDHAIGHSYFMRVMKSEDPTAELHRVWYQQVTPLLEEYFYGNAERLTKVLGAYESGAKKGFVEIVSDEADQGTVGVHRYGVAELLHALKSFYEETEAAQVV